MIPSLVGKVTNPVAIPAIDPSVQASTIRNQRPPERIVANPVQRKTRTTGIHAGRLRLGSTQMGHHQKADARNVSTVRSHSSRIWLTVLYGPRSVVSE